MFFENHFINFYHQQSEKTQLKIDYVLFLVKNVDQVPEKFLKHISGSKGIYELRVEAAGNAIRIFCFFDEGNLVILTNAFLKKTQKTPRKEVVRCERLMADYFDHKRRSNESKK